jgi:hypothetical protein
MLETTGGFFQNPFNRYLVILLFILGASLLLLEEPTQEISEAELTIHYFYSPICPHCAEQDPFNKQLEEDFPEIEIIYHDITVPEQARLFQIMAQNKSIGFSELGTPTTFINGQVFVGFEPDSAERMRDAIEECLEDCEVAFVHQVDSKDSLTREIDLPYFGKTDLSSFSLPLLAIILGLTDGFNPCAMWVLVYLISLFMGLADRKRMILIVGTFVLASGVLYFLLMTAWLNAFLFLGYVRIVTIVVGLVALGGGIISLKEYTKGAPICKADASKKGIMTSMRELVSKPLTWATIIGIIILAFTVNSIEFLCSFALPAVFTQILALSNLSVLEYYGYILLYDIFFMLDDLLIFSLAALTFSGITGEKYAKYCRLIGGVVLVLLALMLLFAPHMLA